MISNTPHPPYYAVIFSSINTTNSEGYAEMGTKMVELASIQDGFLGIESARDSDLGITVSYWRDLESIKNWKQDTEHQFAQKMGKEKWYQSFKTRIAKVERDYGFEKM